MTPRVGALIALTALLFGGTVRAQGLGNVTVGDSRVGYIDSALVGTQFRLRFDDTFNNRRPTRAEFLWAKAGPGPGRPGPPLLEPSVDYQEFTGYVEAALDRRCSAFLEVPFRLVNPTVDDNTAGLADINAGFKYALVSSPDLVATFQFRTYVPTGDADRGLGNHHVSLEPALLVWMPLADWLLTEAELRYWIPVGGTDFAGDIIRYGLGVSCPLVRTSGFQLSPVAEFVGWTVLGGQQSIVTPPAVLVGVEDAAGDTIVNAKLGVRVNVGDSTQFYGGYGRPLTGDRWYENTFRFEFRLFF
jgi:hypothetical protein